MFNMKSFQLLIDSLKKNKVTPRQTVMIVVALSFIILTGITGTYFTFQYFTKAQTCFSTQTVASDSRCLYILNGKVYEKGTKNSPHKATPCGTDVSAIIPSFHTDTPATYLDPNYRGDICAVQQPAATNTPVPAATNTPVPAATNTPVPTQPSQSTQPTATPVRTSTSTPIPTTAGTGTGVTPTPTLALGVSTVTGTTAPTISQLLRTGSAPVWIVYWLPMALVIAGIAGTIL